MMKSSALLLAVAMVILVSACGKNEKAVKPVAQDVTADSVYGVWEGDTTSFTDNKESSQYLVRIEEGLLIKHVSCHFSDGTRLNARAESPIKVGPDSIEVLKADENIVRQDRHSCRAVINVKKLPYQLKNGSLLLTSGNKTAQLKRRVYN